jgi:hypothetical protein
MNSDNIINSTNINANPVTTEAGDISQYSTVSNLLHFTGAISSTCIPQPYPKEMLEKIQKISLFIKKIKLVEDPKYYESRSKEYVKLLKATKAKLEKIMLKTLLYASISKDGKKKSQNKDIDINE